MGDKYENNVNPPRNEKGTENSNSDPVQNVSRDIYNASSGNASFVWRKLLQKVLSKAQGVGRLCDDIRQTQVKCQRLQLLEEIVEKRKCFESNLRTAVEAIDDNDIDVAALMVHHCKKMIDIPHALEIYGSDCLKHFSDILEKVKSEVQINICEFTFDDVEFLRHANRWVMCGLRLEVTQRCINRAVRRIKEQVKPDNGSQDRVSDSSKHIVFREIELISRAFLLSLNEVKQTGELMKHLDDDQNLPTHIETTLSVDVSNVSNIDFSDSCSLSFRKHFRVLIEEITAFCSEFSRNLMQEMRSSILQPRTTLPSGESDLQLFDRQLEALSQCVEFCHRYIRYITKCCTSVSNRENSEDVILAFNQPLQDVLQNLVALFLSVQSEYNSLLFRETSTTDEALAKVFLDDVSYVVRVSITRAIRRGTPLMICSSLNIMIDFLRETFLGHIKRMLDEIPAANENEGTSWLGYTEPTDEQALSNSIIKRMQWANIGVQAADYLAKLHENVIIECTKRDLEASQFLMCREIANELKLLGNVSFEIVHKFAHQLAAHVSETFLHGGFFEIMEYTYEIAKPQISISAWVKSTIQAWSRFFTPYRKLMRETLFSAFLYQLSSVAARSMEQILLEKRCNGVGAVQLERDLNDLILFLSSLSSTPVRDQFGKCFQQLSLLNTQKLPDVLSVIRGVQKWKLTSWEIITVLSCRVEYTQEDIHALELS